MILSFLSCFFDSEFLLELFVRQFIFLLNWWSGFVDFKYFDDQKKMFKNICCDDETVWCRSEMILSFVSCSASCSSIWMPHYFIVLSCKANIISLNPLADRLSEHITIWSVKHRAADGSLIKPKSSDGSEWFPDIKWLSISDCFDSEFSLKLLFLNFFCLSLCSGFVDFKCFDD